MKAGRHQSEQEGIMSRDREQKGSVIDQLEAVRAAVREETMSPEKRAEMEAALSGLERELMVAMPVDAGPLMALLQGWEARLEAEHPVLASVVGDALQKLSSMGI